MNINILIDSNMKFKQKEVKSLSLKQFVIARPKIKTQEKNIKVWLYHMKIY